MSNNVAGATIATDDVAGVHYQVIKLAAGDEDSSARIDGDSTNGLDVDVTRLIPGTAATALGKAEDAAHTTGDTGVMLLGVRQAASADLSAGNTDGDYEPIQVDALGRVWVHTVTSPFAKVVHPTVDTSVYAANDIVGGIVTIANFALVSGGGGILDSLSIFDASNQKAAMEMLLFNATPSGGTYADQGPVTWAAGDYAKYIGKVVIPSAAYTSWGSKAVATISVPALPLVVAATSLFALFVTSGTPTYAAVGDFNVVLNGRY